jgi:predicted AAA+ superfamily ATPase
MVSMRREQKKIILNDLKKKMVFLVGPRQVGKTYLAKEILKEYAHPKYLNYDLIEDRKYILAGKWDAQTDLIIFDELHKMPKWKNFLKGHFDTRNPHMHMLVTGSARLETYTRAGDSLAGRFLVHHLLPLSLKELEQTVYAGGIDRLMERGGFPEPFLAETTAVANIWRNNYVDSLVREDAIDFGSIEKVKTMRDVFQIVRTKVGAPLSYQNIANDVGVSPVTVKRYIGVLEALYVVFLVRPYSKKVSRSILKEPKVYFYDTALVVGDDGTVFENMIATALLKHVYGLRETQGVVRVLNYIKTKEKKEVDFALVTEFGDVEQLVEVKLSDDVPTETLRKFTQELVTQGVQVVKNMRQTHESGGVRVVTAQDFLTGLVL